MRELVSIEWLSKNLGKKDLVLLDTSLDQTADAKYSTYKELTIPAARYLDLKANFSDRNTELPNTLPSKEQFESECRKLGINQTSEIVVFDNLGIYSSPRVWWMFKIMGHDKISVLDGGLPEWINKGHKTEKKQKQSYEVGNFKASFIEDFVVTYADIHKNITQKDFTIIDARSEGRFKGTAPEPRKELKSGSIEESVNIPFKEVLSHGKYKPIAELKDIFDKKCKTKDQLVFSCGSGLTACIVLLASEVAFKKSRYVYDGSWTEWAEKNKLKNDEQ